MSFTSAEIRGAVDAFLNSPVEVPTLRTGARDILLARDRAFDLLVNALVGDPRSIYHLAWLASNRLYGLISDQAADLAHIQRASLEIQQVKFRPYGQLNELTTAQSALLEIDAAAGGGGPGIGRFQRVTRQFAARELRPTLAPVTDGGVTTIPDTPLNLRRDIQRTWSAVKARDGGIKDICSRLGSLLREFGALRLPERSVRTLIGKLRERTEVILDELSSSKAEEASRKAYLDLLVMDSILSKTARFESPALVLAQGLDAVLSSPSAGQVAKSSLSGPYSLVGGETLRIVVDGVTELVPIPVPSTIKGKVRAQDVADAINANSSVTANVRLFSLSTTAYISSNPGSENKLYLPLHAAHVGETNAALDTIKVADWISDDDFTYASKVLIDAPGLQGTYLITARNPATRTFTLSPGISVTGTGLDYAVLGPAITGVFVGDKVDIRDPINGSAGSIYYEVSIISDVVTLDNNIVEYEYNDGVTPPYYVRFFSGSEVELFTEYLDITGPPGSTLSIPTNAISTALGLDVGSLLAPISAGESTSVRIPDDLGFLGGASGDVIELSGVQYGVEGVASSPTGYIVELSQPISYTATPLSYRYLSGQHLAFQTMLDGVATYPTDLIDQFDTLVSQTIHGKSAARIYSEIGPVHSTLTSIQGILKTYKSPGRSTSLDAAIVMMREQGMDRAADLLLSLRLTELFTMGRDGVSYNTHLARAAATATRVVSPVSKDQSNTEDVIGAFEADIGLTR